MNELIKYVPAYLKYLSARNYSPRTIENHRENITFFFNWLHKKKFTLLSQLNYRTLLDYQLNLSHTKSQRTGRYLSNGTQSNRIKAVKIFFKYLTKIDVIIHNPAAELKTPQYSSTINFSLLSIPEIKKVLTTPDLSTAIGIRDRSILETLYSTGVRATELCNLKLRDVQYDTNTITIHSGKGSKDRVVPICNRALYFLKQYIDKPRKKFISGQPPQQIFISHKGKPFNKNTLRPLVRKYGEKCGLKKIITTHCFRIASATHMLKAGADIRYVQQFLGHVQIDATMHYLRFDQSELKRIHTLSHPREQDAKRWK